MRWWWWLLLAVAVAVLVAAVVRWQGYRRWQQAKADAAAAGLVVDVAGLVAGAPAINRRRQESLWQLLEGWNAPSARWTLWSGSVLFSDLQEGRCVRDPAAVARNLEEGAASIAALEALLDEGPVLVSVMGWGPAQESRWVDLLAAEDQQAWRTSSLLAVRAAALWWGSQAVIAPKPQPFLRRLDQWILVQDHPGTLIDAMVAMAIARIRDDSYLWLATRGRLPDDCLAAWLAEPARQVRWCADGLAGERVLYLEALARMPAEAPLRMNLPRIVVSVADLFHVFKFHNVAQDYRLLAATELVLRNRPPLPAGPLMPVSAPPSIFCPNGQESVLVAIEAAVHHRLWRIAGGLAAHHRAGHPLPADAEALVAALPVRALVAGSPHQPAIRYQRLSATRFRIGIDAQERPLAIPAERWEQEMRNGGPTSGRPAAAGAVDKRRWSLELDLDAILLPARPATGCSTR